MEVAAAQARIEGRPAGGPVVVTAEAVRAAMQSRAIVYDGDGDAHYDTLSAFIKSMRGSDPDAAVYWLARMLEAGEDPRAIARRLIVHAAEDVGNADPRRCPWPWRPPRPWSTWDCPKPGSPGPGGLYIATAPKSNAAYLGPRRALEAVAPSVGAGADPFAGHIVPGPNGWVTAPDTNIRTTIRTITCRSSICPATWRAGRFTSPATKARRPRSAGAWSGCGNGAAPGRRARPGPRAAGRG